MSFFDLYNEFCIISSRQEQVADWFADEFRSFLSNSVAKCVDYPVVKWDAAYQHPQIIVSTHKDFFDDLERDLDSIKCIKIYTFTENDKGTWRDYYIILDYEKMLKHELGIMI